MHIYLRRLLKGDRRDAATQQPVRQVDHGKNGFGIFWPITERQQFAPEGHYAGKVFTTPHSNGPSTGPFLTLEEERRQRADVTRRSRIKTDYLIYFVILAGLMVWLIAHQVAH